VFREVADGPLVRVEGLTKHFPITRGILRRRVGVVRAVDGVSFEIRRGETLGMVGESGCGKSTTGRAILLLTRPTTGRIYLDGVDLARLDAASLRGMRRRMQLVFQDPHASLDPRMTIGRIIGEPLEVFGQGSRSDRRRRVAELMGLVGLNPDLAGRYPHEFSGGQRQRVGIARALALHPDFVVCDEPISALDVSIQAQVVNLLKDLQQRLGLTYLFIGHDLAMVRHISDRVAVMYLGKLVELTDQATVYSNPLHPYTQALLAAVPTPDPRVESQRRRIPLAGDLPGPAAPPAGCRFHPRCPLAEQVCRREEPELREVSPGHHVACHLLE
jgi:oligopeptide transport system ATP-binding protein